MNKTSTTHPKEAKGFTLLELLIVIAIIAILATIIVIIINPVEILKRARDVQRLSDLASTRTAIALYLTTQSSPSLDGLTGISANSRCKSSNNEWDVINSRVYYSMNGGSYSTVQPTTNTATNVQTSVSNTPSRVDGTGWIPIDLGSSLSGSSPLSNLPLDPINVVVNGSTIGNTDLVYRYACRQSPLSFELNTRLESIMYTQTDNKHISDGGDNNSLYEIGTRLDILGNGSQF